MVAILIHGVCVLFNVTFPTGSESTEENLSSQEMAKVFITPVILEKRQFRKKKA